jgi:hypothetical protein
VKWLAAVKCCHSSHTCAKLAGVQCIAAIPGSVRKQARAYCLLLAEVCYADSAPSSAFLTDTMRSIGSSRRACVWRVALVSCI